MELTTLLTAIGAIALKEKWRSIASWAKIMPPIGELNPAEIAAATPQPMKVSFVRRWGDFLFMRFPIVPPRCTKGPYCPTDAPPLADTKAEKVDKNPVLGSRSCEGECALSITSAGPWYLSIFNVLLTKIINTAQASKNNIGCPLKQTVPISKKQLLNWSRQLEIYPTPDTKPTDVIETTPPTIAPKIITWKTIPKVLNTKKVSPTFFTAIL